MLFKKKERNQNLTRDNENLRLFINDVMLVIDRNAPCFREIKMECQNKSYIDYESIVITDVDNKILKYNYEKHGFAIPSNEAKKQLAIEISQKYNGIWFEDKVDDSENSVPRWRILRYRIIAHEALEEMKCEKKRRDNLLKC